MIFWLLSGVEHGLYKKCNFGKLPAQLSQRCLECTDKPRVIKWLEQFMGVEENSRKLSVASLLVRLGGGE